MVVLESLCSLTEERRRLGLISCFVEICKLYPDMRPGIGFIEVACLFRQHQLGVLNVNMNIYCIILSVNHITCCFV